MKIVLLAVTSIDGFITNGDDPNIYKWTSREDQKFFFQQIEKAKLIFMGSKTYETAKHFIKHKKGRTRIIFTRNPEKYKQGEVKGILEFTKDNPVKVIERFEKLGVSEALLVGGSEINSLFFKHNLISEMYITIEPIIFGKGKKLFNSNVKSAYQLDFLKKLNKKGTTLLHYTSP